MLRTAPLVTFLALLCAVSASFSAEDDFPAVLLKRQAPGTPAYECHLNCGTAIIIGRTAADPCTNSTFLSDYSACLDCAGPDNENIWQYYGTTLTTYGTECGLSTTPVSNSTSASSTSESSIAVTSSASSTTSTSLVTSTSALATATSSASTTVSSTASATENGTATSTPLVVTGSGSVARLEGVGFLAVLAAVFAHAIW